MPLRFNRRRVIAPALTPLAAMLIAAVILAACGSDPASPRPEAGEYVLETINGQALPVTVTSIEPPSTQVVQTATLRVTPSKSAPDSYRLMVHGTRNGETLILLDDVGEYSVAGDKINFTSKVDPSRSYAGTLVADTMLVSLPSLALRSGGIAFLRFHK